MEFHDRLRTKNKGDSEIEISGISDEELLSALSEGIQKVDEQDIGEE